MSTCVCGMPRVEHWFTTSRSGAYVGLCQEYQPAPEENKKEIQMPKKAKKKNRPVKQVKPKTTRQDDTDAIAGDKGDLE